jgi:hypothetical protein
MHEFNSGLDAGSHMSMGGPNRKKLNVLSPTVRQSDICRNASSKRESMMPSALIQSGCCGVFLIWECPMVRLADTSACQRCVSACSRAACAALTWADIWNDQCSSHRF